MTVGMGVLLPLRIETRFRDGDLWLRVVPDEPWFVRDDPRITPAELDALRRYAAALAAAPTAAVTSRRAAPPAWRDLAAAVGAPRAAFLARTYLTTADETPTVPDPPPDRLRTGLLLPRIAGFPAQLQVWLDFGAGPTQVLQLSVDRDRLLANLPDPEVAADRRWWDDWDEAVAVGVAAVVPAAELTGTIQALYVTGLGDGDPADLFGDLAAEGRLGLLEPGLPTNSVDGRAAAALATDADSWWAVRAGRAGPGDSDVSTALTGSPTTLGHLPGGERPHRTTATSLVTALWPALWGFAAGQVFDIARGPAPAIWASSALFPEGAYPIVRVGPQPYGLLPTTAWSKWQPDADDPTLEAPLVRALLTLRARHAGQAMARGTAVGQDTDGLLDLIADTPTSGQFRFRRAWPLQLWWLSSAGSGLPATWRDFEVDWRTRHPLAAELAVTPLRHYGTRGPSRRIGIPLVVPTGAAATDLPALLTALADAVTTQPTRFADSAAVEQQVLDGHGDSLLLRLAVRSVQVLIGDLARAREAGADPVGFDPEPIARGHTAQGRLERLIAAASVTPAGPTDSAAWTGLLDQLHQVQTALRDLAGVAVPELERMLRATVDCSSHRIDPWLLAVPQRRMDTLQAAGVLTRRLGAYGWVDAPAPGRPGPTPAGLIHAPTPAAAMTAAVLRDRAISDPAPRWRLAITSRTARAAEQIAAEVRAGAHVYEVLGREVERIVGRAADVATLRRRFPVRAEHAGRRVCDGVAALAQDALPITLSADQQAQLDLLREALDSYGDLLVVDAVQHVVEGRAATAGQAMDAAAGLSRPPELSLLRSTRNGRAVTSSIALALPHVATAPLPADPFARALRSPATALDPSVAAVLVAHTGVGQDWDFVVGPDQPTTSVSLHDLGLPPVDALALPLATLHRLAVEHTGRDTATSHVVGGRGGVFYEQAAQLVGLIGRRPTEQRTFRESRTGDPPERGVDADTLDRYRAARDIGTALVEQLRAEVALLGTGSDLGHAHETKLRTLLQVARAWGIAPDTAAGLAEAARLVLPQMTDRLAAAPDPDSAGQLSREAFGTAAAALVSPTGHVALTSAVPSADLATLSRAPALDVDWLTVVAAVRPALARLEAHQLGAGRTFTAWTNRPTDPWQTDAADPRPLIVVHAPPGLDLTAPGTVATAALDRFDEVIPAVEQRIGAAFGFDAPAARAPQAILLAVPPSTSAALDPSTLVQILVETRELAHARMARPVDLEQQYWGLAPTGLLPATGALAVPLEVPE